MLLGGCWLVVVGWWLLVVGCWLWVMGYGLSVWRSEISGKLTFFRFWSRQQTPLPLMKNCSIFPFLY